MNDYKKLLGQRIKELRKSKGITQEYLAELVGIGPANISYIENGKFAPSMENFQKIARALDVTPNELYMFEHLKNPQELKQELNDAFKSEDLLRLIYKFYITVK